MMFTCRAKRLDNGEGVEGFFHLGRIDINVSPKPRITDMRGAEFAIDPSTLQLSFNGTDWYDVATIKEAMSVKSCNDCTYLNIEQYRGFEIATCTNEKCTEIYDCDVGADFSCNKFEPKH